MDNNIKTLEPENSIFRFSLYRTHEYDYLNQIIYAIKYYNQYVNIDEKYPVVLIHNSRKIKENIIIDRFKEDFNIDCIYKDNQNQILVNINNFTDKDIFLYNLISTIFKLKNCKTLLFDNIDISDEFSFLNEWRNYLPDMYNIFESVDVHRMFYSGYSEKYPIIFKKYIECKKNIIDNKNIDQDIYLSYLYSVWKSIMDCSFSYIKRNITGPRVKVNFNAVITSHYTEKETNHTNCKFYFKTKNDLCPIYFFYYHFIDSPCLRPH